jgi:hypothetical protein
VWCWSSSPSSLSSGFIIMCCHFICEIIHIYIRTLEVLIFAHDFLLSLSSTSPCHITECNDTSWYSSILLTCATPRSVWMFSSVSFSVFLVVIHSVSFSVYSFLVIYCTQLFCSQSCIYDSADHHWTVIHMHCFMLWSGGASKYWI